ncbi:hypothetical protein CELL_00165 [Cellulomonas sp. T2.31MG-18]|uniref:flippase-like domain-containing protein n=1 Tax=Cellulomonas sp. T2.31MG-18 TaxID=3157619 RepID=UPI0035EE1C52
MTAQSSGPGARADDTARNVPGTDPHEQPTLRLHTAVPPPPVEVIDVPTSRVQHPSDLLGVVLGVLGVALVLALASYAHNTTSGVAEDVQGFATLLRRILFVPVNALVGLITLAVPLLVLGEQALRRRGRLLLETMVGGAAALALNAGVHWLISGLTSTDLAQNLSIRVGTGWQLTLPAYAALAAGVLTVAGSRVSTSVRWGWNALWVAVGITLITGQVSLPGVAVSVLLGRIVGMAVRYVSGVAPQRAYGEDLAVGVRRAGYTPRRLVRVPDQETAAAPHRDRYPPLPDPDPASAALARSSGTRVYRVETAYDEVLDLVVLDRDRQVVGSLARLWRSLRLRGLEGRSVVSLRQAAERAALLSYAAEAAGVDTPGLLRIGENADSMLLLLDHPHGGVPLTDLPDARLTDELLRAVWAQLRRAHAAGIAHRAVTSDNIVVGPVSHGVPRVWLTGWEQGDVASSELARRMDLMQVLALLALRVGAERAVRSAADALDAADVAAIGPLLQTIALPRQTREAMRAHKEVLTEVREALVARLPQADVEPQQLVRFGARTLLTIIVTVVAVFVVLTTINVNEIAAALRASDWRYSVLAYGLGLMTLLGGALALVAFSPVKVPLWRATLVQTAGTFVALAAPAGIGPAALNLRTLTKRGVSATLAAATVALVQVTQFVVTVLLLLVLSLLSGTQQQSALPVSPVVLVAVAAVAGLVAAALLVPRVRQWALAKAMPTLRQTWPRFIQVIGQPTRLGVGLLGSTVMTMGYVLAFDASLAALGQNASLVKVAIVYLAGTTAGSLVPTPGGVGTVEAALTASLGAVVGLNPGVALSVAVLFRVLTYWLRIPLGWVAMRRLQKLGEL